MDNAKLGNLISQLRKEKELTQQQLADALNISNKTVSKWECGQGGPDVSLLPELSLLLGVEMGQLIEGELTANLIDAGNIVKTRFYVCPACNNIMTSTSHASMACCGRTLEPLVPQQDEHTPSIQVEMVDIEFYVSIAHEMTRDHYLLFAAYVSYDKVFLTRLYPEQEAAVRLPLLPLGTLYLYCMKHGLTRHKMKVER